MASCYRSKAQKVMLGGLALGLGLVANQDAHGQCSGCTQCLPSLPMLSLVPAAARASNLPSDNGASPSERGTIRALQKVKDIQSAVKLAKSRSSLSDIRLDLNGVYALKEKGFKRVFDEYSEGISYKQQFLDKNAFLVYYTQGYDGPNRDNIEKESSGEALQKAQYGYRNDAWVALDETISELDYLLEQSEMGDDLESRKELNKDLSELIVALDRFIELAPAKQKAVLNE